MGKKWEKFLLLMWKNWLLQWRHPLQTFIEIIAPVLFCALLVLIRSIVDPEEHQAKYYEPFDPLASPMNFSNANVSLLAYSPSGNSKLDAIMSDTATQLGLFPRGYETSQAMELALDNELTLAVTLAGVQFDNSLAINDSLPENLHAAIRFPSQLRDDALSQFQVNTWRTFLLFPVYQIAGPRCPDCEQTATPGYFGEGFLAVQTALSNAFVRHLNESVELPEITMQRYPYPTWMNDPLLTALQSFVGIIIMLSFVYTCINTVKIITTEKEKQLKEAMKIMGLPNWLHWTAWFIKTFTYLLISIILMVILLKVSWYPGTTFSVFTLSDPFVMFIFLLFYICATITFCFAISVFFSKANTAAAVAGMLWFLSYAPYLFLQDQYDSITLGVKLVSSLGSNSAMAFGFQLILMHEGTGEGLQWHNLFKSATPDDTLTLGYIILMLIFDSLLYLLVALYVEQIFPGEYGIPQVWYFPFTASFWCGTPRYSGTEHFEQKPPGNNEMFEKEPTSLHPGIKIMNLRKVFGNKKTAVRDMYLNMYENHITVLLGHNGAGKTTTMSMLTGILTPTSGTALVGGYDIRTEMDKVRDSLGLCPQHNIIFEEFTVKEHLYFFSKLKGVDKKDIDREIQKYVELLELVPKANAKSATLSGGMKRKLCVGIALCGNSKVVMLDEPTAGMDPSARRALWDLLQTQKIGRTMLLTTHFMDEADLLGDRIAIMAGGQVQCCGSSFFLKKKYGAGYHLIMDKSESCKVDEVTSLLRKHIPDIEVENSVGSELTYVLNENQSPLFEEMLHELEQKSDELGITSYGISLTTLEEVFMKVGADHGQEEMNNALEEKNHLQNPDLSNGHHISNELNKASSVTKLQIGEDYFLTGFALLRNQILAMVMKKFLSTLRTWILMVIQIILPVVFLIITIVVTRSYDVNRDLPELKLTLDPYANPITVVSGSGPYKEQYKSILNQSGHVYEDISSESVSDYMINRTEEEVSTVRQRYIIGGTFDESSVNLWFNNQPYHSPPLALAMGLSSIVKTLVNYTLEMTNYPLPYTISTRFNQLSQGNTMGFQLAFNIGFGMAFVSSFYVLFYVRERVTKAKHLQFVSGVDVTTFWLTSFICDLLTFIFTSICLLITLVAFQEGGFQTFEEIARVFVLLLVFGYCMLPIEFLASYLFEVPSTGYTRMTLFNIITGVAAFLTVQVLSTEGLDLEYVAEKLDWIFLSMPHYSLSSGIRNLYTIWATYDNCESVVKLCAENTNGTIDQCWIAVCAAFEGCCDINMDYFAWDEPGVGRNIFFSFIVGTIALVLLLIIEFGVFSKLMYKINANASSRPMPIPDEDVDVANEKEKIRNSSLAEYTVVLKDLTKYYKKFLAVNGLSLGIKRYECFGLLGINGAGKTTTFKMMTGDVDITYGDAWVNGMSLKTDLKRVHKQIGYCPQFDAVLDDLTGKETMIMFCLLRGITLADSRVIAENLAREFDFYRHLNKKVKEYSGGNKRKLSTAIALIGDPPVIYLDEPTTGMDPATKRYLWNALCRVRDSGKCIVLTSHSMEECEALCTRLAIMVNGNFRCLGSTQHLKNKFSDGYTLTIKVRKSGGDADNICAEEVAQIEAFVKEHFPSAVLREKYQELLSYYIKGKSMLWSKMFGIMEKGKREINIEDYSIGQSSLEQVFLTFTKLQREQ